MNKPLTLRKQEFAPARSPLLAPPVTLDAFIPPEMAAKAEDAGVKKATDDSIYKRTGNDIR